MGLSCSRLGDEARNALAAFFLRARPELTRAEMTLLKLSEDEQRTIFGHLCSVLEPRFAVYFSSASRGLRESTQALRHRLRIEHEAAVKAICLKVGVRSKELREAKEIEWHSEPSLSWWRRCGAIRGLPITLSRLNEDEQSIIFGHWRNLLKLFVQEVSATDLATLGKLGSVLPALETLGLARISCADTCARENCRDLLCHSTDGVQRFAEGLCAGALPALAQLTLSGVHLGDTGASALAAALGRGALPRLWWLDLCQAAITDAGLAALGPALRRRPALTSLSLEDNPFGDEGLAALLAPPPLRVATELLPPTGGLEKLSRLCLDDTQVSDAGCATLTAALNSGALPALEMLYFRSTRDLGRILAIGRDVARAAVEHRAEEQRRQVLERVEEQRRQILERRRDRYGF